MVLVKGRIDKREDQPQLLAQDLALLDLGEADSEKPVVILITANRVNDQLVAQLRETLSTHPGTTEVHLKLQHKARATRWRLGDNVRVAPTPALMADLKALLGPAAIE